MTVIAPRGRRRIAVAGGGLGGLATAIALSAIGEEVTVYEQARALGEIGAGIHISPQATKALWGMGLRDVVARTGDVMTGQIQRNMYSGDQLAETPLGENGHYRFGAPYYVFHRADLLEALASAVPGNRVKLNHRLAVVEEHPDRILLHFENGAVEEADLLIGADGIHSRVRSHLYGEDEARFTGQMVWRALLDASAFPDDILGPHGSCGWIGKGCHIMSYYLRGGSIINITTQSDSDVWQEEGWSIPGDPDRMRSYFPDCAPQLQSLLDAVTTCSKWGLFGREPSQNWGRGRIQLIGDAAHPLLPNAGQGAAQAFEDAYVLSRWLDRHADDPERAFSEFRRIRIPRAHAVQRQSQANSKLVHAGDWEQRQEAFRAREAVGDTPLGLSWIYAYEPESEWEIRREYPLSFEPRS